MNEAGGRMRRVDLERFLLARLERFVRLATSPGANRIPAWSHLARRALLSAHRDCVDLGLVREANAALARGARRSPEAEVPPSVKPGRGPRAGGGF